MLKFQRYYTHKKTLPFFCPKIVRNFCSTKLPYYFSAKNTAKNDFVSAIRLNKSLTKDALNNSAQVYNGMFEGADRMTGYLDLHCLHRPVLIFRNFCMFTMFPTFCKKWMGLDFHTNVSLTGYLKKIRGVEKSMGLDFTS